MQKIKGMFDSTSTVAQQITDGMELATYLLTPVAIYSVLGLIVAGVSIIISWFIPKITLKIKRFIYVFTSILYLFIFIFTD